MDIYVCTSVYNAVIHQHSLGHMSEGNKHDLAVTIQLTVKCANSTFDTVCSYKWTHYKYEYEWYIPV